MTCGGRTTSSRAHQGELIFSAAAVMEELLRGGLRVRLAVRGPSMEPTLSTGDAVIVAALGDGFLRPGELAVFRMGDRLYAHRFHRWIVDGTGSPMLEFVADAKPEPDPPIDPEAVIARIVAVERAALRPPTSWPWRPWLDGLRTQVGRGLSALLGP